MIDRGEFSEEKIDGSKGYIITLYSPPLVKYNFVKI
jgi:hypothetical protein